MPMDPDAVRALAVLRLANLAPVETLTPPEARAAYRRARGLLQSAPVEVAEISERSAPGPAGAVPLRLYRGLGAAAGRPAPVLVYFHGGGWVIGDLDTHDGVCRGIANAARCVVVAVDYRLAPENKFPAAVEDCTAALTWIAGEGRALGVDTARLAVGGDSAGGNLAAVMALLARDGSVPPVCHQVLIYPATDFRMTAPAYERFTSGLPLTASSTRWFADQYLSRPEDAVDWRVSPARAADLSGVAPAFVLTAAFDPLVDEGREYAARLEREGVRVVYVHVADQIHGFLTMGGVMRAADTAIAMIGAALRDTFSR